MRDPGGEKLVDHVEPVARRMSAGSAPARPGSVRGVVGRYILPVVAFGAARMFAPARGHRAHGRCRILR
jgi:hypothetical protein